MWVWWEEGAEGGVKRRASGVAPRAADLHRGAGWDERPTRVTSRGDGARAGAGRDVPVVWGMWGLWGAA